MVLHLEYFWHGETFGKVLDLRLPDDQVVEQFTRLLRSIRLQTQPKSQETAGEPAHAQPPA